MIKKNSPWWIFADFCEIASKATIKKCAKFHFVMNLCQVVMNADLFNRQEDRLTYHKCSNITTNNLKQFHWDCDNSNHRHEKI